jgi:hypothetical protein
MSANGDERGGVAVFRGSGGWAPLTVLKGMMSCGITGRILLPPVRVGTAVRRMLRAGIRMKLIDRY